MTETEHLIHQAAREIGITINQDLVLTAPVEKPGLYIAQFKNRRGDATQVDILMDTEFRKIHDLLKAAWKGQTSKVG